MSMPFKPVKAEIWLAILWTATIGLCLMSKLPKKGETDLQKSIFLNTRMSERFSMYRSEEGRYPQHLKPPAKKVIYQGTRQFLNNLRVSDGTDTLRVNAYARGSNKGPGQRGGDRDVQFMDLWEEENEDEDEDEQRVFDPEAWDWDPNLRVDEAFVRSLDKFMPMGRIFVISSPVDEVNPIIQKSVDKLYDLDKSSRLLGLSTRWSRGATIGPSIVAVSSPDTTLIYRLPEYAKACELLTQPFPPPSLMKVLQDPVVKAVHGDLHDIGSLWETWGIDSLHIVDTIEVATTLNLPNYQRRNLVASFTGYQIDSIEKEPNWSNATKKDFRKLAVETQATLFLLDKMYGYLSETDLDKWVFPILAPTSDIIETLKAFHSMEYSLKGLYNDHISEVNQSDRFPDETVVYKKQIDAWTSVKEQIENFANGTSNEDENIWQTPEILQGGILYADRMISKLREWDMEQDSIDAFALLPTETEVEGFEILDPVPPRYPKRIRAFNREMMKLEVNALLKNRSNELGFPYNYHPLLKLNAQLKETFAWLRSIEAFKDPRWKARDAQHAAMERLKEIESHFKDQTEQVIKNQEESRQKSFVLRELRKLEERINQTLEENIDDSPKTSKVKKLEAIRDYLENVNIDSRPRPWNEPSVVRLAIDILDSQIATVSLTVEEEENAEPESPADYAWMTMKELKSRLREKGLPVSGSKAALVERLTDAFHETRPDSEIPHDNPQDLDFEQRTFGETVALESSHEFDPLESNPTQIERGSFSSGPVSSDASSSRSGKLPMDALGNPRHAFYRRGIWQNYRFSLLSRTSWRSAGSRQTLPAIRVEIPRSFDGDSPPGPPKKEDIQDYYLIDRDKRSRQRGRSKRNAEVDPEELDFDVDEEYDSEKKWQYDGPEIIRTKNERETVVNEAEVRELVKAFMEDVDNMEEFKGEIEAGPWDERAQLGVKEILEPQLDEISPLDPRVRERMSFRLKKSEVTNSPDMVEDELEGDHSPVLDRVVMEEDAPDETIQEDDPTLDDFGDETSYMGHNNDHSSNLDAVSGSEDPFNREDADFGQGANFKEVSEKGGEKEKQRISEKDNADHNDPRVSKGASRTVACSSATSQTIESDKDQAANMEPEIYESVEGNIATAQTTVAQGPNILLSRPGVLIPYKSRGPRIEQNYTQFVNQDSTTENSSLDQVEDIDYEIDDPYVEEAPEKLEYDDPEGRFGVNMDISLIRKEPWFDQIVERPIPDYLMPQLRRVPRTDPTSRELKRLIESYSRKGMPAHAIKVELENWHNFNMSLKDIHDIRLSIFQKPPKFGLEPRDRMVYVNWNIDWDDPDHSDLIHLYEQPPPAARVQVAPFSKGAHEEQLQEKAMMESYERTAQLQQNYNRGRRKRGNAKSESNEQSGAVQKAESARAGRLPRRRPVRGSVSRGGSPSGQSIDLKGKSSRRHRAPDMPESKTESGDEIGSDNEHSKTAEDFSGINPTEGFNVKRESFGSSEATKKDRQILSEQGLTPDKNYENLTVVNLRNELKLRGLPISGRKKELVDRLQRSDSSGKHSRA